MIGKRALLVIAAIGSVTVGGGAFLMTPSEKPGHTFMHVNCKNHNHGPLRTAGAGKRLMEARALNRAARGMAP